MLSAFWSWGSQRLVRTLWTEGTIRFIWYSPRLWSGLACCTVVIFISALLLFVERWISRLLSPLAPWSLAGTIRDLWPKGDAGSIAAGSAGWAYAPVHRPILRSSSASISGSSGCWIPKSTSLASLPFAIERPWVIGGSANFLSVNWNMTTWVLSVVVVLLSFLLSTSTLQMTAQRRVDIGLLFQPSVEVPLCADFVTIEKRGCWNLGAYVLLRLLLWPEALAGSWSVLVEAVVLVQRLLALEGGVSGLVSPHLLPAAVFRCTRLGTCQPWSLLHQFLGAV